MPKIEFELDDALFAEVEAAANSGGQTVEDFARATVVTAAVKLGWEATSLLIALRRKDVAPGETIPFQTLLSYCGDTALRDPDALLRGADALAERGFLEINEVSRWVKLTPAGHDKAQTQ